MDQLHLGIQDKITQAFSQLDESHKEETKKLTDEIAALKDSNSKLKENFESLYKENKVDIRLRQFGSQT